ncbi:MAG TPA: hypothetical protein D7H99_01100 [Candidatus Poseidoniales archaeon]|nr:MAG TPA: hypothetical protein D7H99_01100 [Candidatus Poseidoniales archaeon]
MVGDLSINVQLPDDSGNSKLKVLVNPGPRELMPSLDSTFLLSLVWIKISRLPTGIADSFARSTVTCTTSSSSSSISMTADISRHSIGEALVKCSSVMLTLL